MLWRHLCLVRAFSAAGLLTCTLSGASALAEPAEPPPATAAETVKILEAQKAGDLKVEARGHGQERVRISLRNTSAKRLNVVLPPGLVAASATGQGRPAGGAGGGFQSMGLGSPVNQPGSFGQFRGAESDAGFQSIPVEGNVRVPSVAVPPGQTVELTLPAVCLNFGLPTPTGRDKFVLKNVDDYSGDVRVRKALRSLATYGTSQGVAQAVMWKVCNDVPFDLMIAQAGKLINVHEVGLAARFVEALDASNDGELVDPAYLTEARLFLRVDGEATLAADAKRLGEALDGHRLLGLPVRLTEGNQPPPASAPALLVNVVLSSGKAGETRGRVVLSRASLEGRWSVMGKTNFTNSTAASVLEGAALAKTLDRAIASAFVSVKPARRAVGSTTLKIENHLPFTLANVVLKAGTSSGSPSVPYKALGVGPGRSALAPIQAPTGTVERVELNGL